jgi:hypothetical protein
MTERTLITHKNCGGSLFYYDTWPARGERITVSKVMLRDGTRPPPGSHINLTCERCSMPITHAAQFEPFGGYANEQLPAHHPV